MSPVVPWLVGQGGGVLFLSAQMSQNSINDVLVFNAGNNLYSSPSKSARRSFAISYAKGVRPSGAKA